MKTRMILSALALALLPYMADAQGKGKGHAKHGKGNSKVSVTGTKVKPNKTAVKVKTSNGTVKTRAARRDVAVYTGRKQGPPPWAPAHGYRRQQHVYFPDYYTFYDPNRGYVYWNNGNWITSSALPGFLSSIDLGRARIQFLNDMPLTVYPETRYRTYMQAYPARTVNIAVPVPR